MRHSEWAKIQGKEPDVSGLLLPGVQWLCYMSLGKGINVSPDCLPLWETGTDTDLLAVMPSAGETPTLCSGRQLGDTRV